MKSIKLMTVVCLLLFHTAVSAQVLILHHADGSTTSVDLKTMPEVSFSDQFVFVTSPTVNMQFHKDDVLSFTYGNLASAVVDVSDTDAFTRQGNNLIFHGAKQAPDVSVYSLNGMRVPLKSVRQQSDVIISLSSLPAGVYILSINGKTSKFIKK